MTEELRKQNKRLEATKLQREVREGVTANKLAVEELALRVVAFLNHDTLPELEHATDKKS